jgi:phage FluMu protein Com
MNAAKVEFQCQFCAHVFKRALRTGLEEVRCPRCREYDVLPTEYFGKLTKPEP